MLSSDTSTLEFNRIESVVCTYSGIPFLPEATSSVDNGKAVLGAYSCSAIILSSGFTSSGPSSESSPAYSGSGTSFSSTSFCLGAFAFTAYAFGPAFAASYTSRVISPDPVICTTFMAVSALPSSLLPMRFRGIGLF